jgi:hypothetical protein
MSSTAMASEKHFESGPERVALIELYTSEGCSSCPPAEEWIAMFRNSDSLWHEVVPVVFHVSYWDSLGWRDPFASREYTQRQYAQSEAWKSSQVYTPCFVRNGVEWRPGQTTSPSEKAGVLSVRWTGDEATVAFTPTKLGKMWDARVAFLGCGFISQVRAGENAGRTLRHEFVVLRLVSLPLSEMANGEFSGSTKVAVMTVLVPERRALAIWVVQRGELVPAQATGGWID